MVEAEAVTGRLRRAYARLACRLRGHIMVSIVTNDRHRVRVGEGCVRPGCAHGTVSVRPWRGPVSRTLIRVEPK